MDTTPAYEWWDSLDAGSKARLRRCRRPVDALLHPETLSLMRRIGRRDDRAAALAIVLAHVTEDGTRHPMRVVGCPKFGGEPSLNEARFRSLITTDEIDDVMTAMIRLAAYMGGRVSVRELVPAILFWNDRTRASWAANFYAATTETENV